MTWCRFNRDDEDAANQQNVPKCMYVPDDGFWRQEMGSIQMEMHSSHMDMDFSHLEMDSRWTVATRRLALGD